MKIFVKAKPRAKEAKIEVIDAFHFEIAVKEPPVKGLANQAIVKSLADHFQVAPSEIRLVTGFSSRNKIFEIRI